MEQRIEQDVEGWPTRPFEDGYDGLRQLAAADFSGVVRAGGAWLFFVNGKIVGIFEGELEDVDGSQGTAHKAPHPSLPLLYAMQATGGDTRAKYYTNDTPISEVHDTLSSGAFTGYIELSENVLSGDYYQLFHGGRSMSVAFVGNSGRMITGDEAFERADDEVGIYEVVDVNVDVEVTDVPQPSSDDDTEDAAGGAEESETDSGDDGDAAASDDPGTEATRDDPDEGEDTEESENATAATASSTDASTSTESATESTGPTATESAAATESGDGESAADAGDVPAGATASGTTGEPPSAAESSTDRDGDTGTRAADASTGQTARSESGGTRGSRGSAADGAGTQGSDRATPDRTAAVSESSTAAEPADDGEPHFQDEATWQEATTVPSLDPDRSEDGEPDAGGGSGGGQRGRQRQSRQQSSQQARQQSRNQSRQNSRQRQSEREQSSSSSSQAVDDTLQEEVLEREDRIDRLQQRVENFEEEREELADERDRLADRVESLTEENESLRGEIRQLEQELEAATPSGAGGQSAQPATDEAGNAALAPRTALEGADLFVRYDSKSEPTLEAAHGDSADRTAVNQNLRLDVHTQFQEEGATVDGKSFHDFLEETMAYRFVEWLVRTLPYEIQETGSESALRDLYDALPEIDRVEFHGEVARDAMEGEEGAPSETFDVVVRDKMGEALFVANMNESRDPATGRMIVDLEEAASRVKEHSMALAGAFVVTRSFFEPAALETTSEATSGSLLSRDSRKSYVKLSRKQGYHLCLVEARGDDLHLNVPEL